MQKLINRLEDYLNIDSLSPDIIVIWTLCVFFLFLFFFFFFFLIISRVVKNKKEKRIRRIKETLQNVLSELLFDEMYDGVIANKDTQGLKDKIGSLFFDEKLAYTLLGNELFELHKNYKGEIAEKTETIFLMLGFQDSTKQKISSNKWYEVAEGILEAQEMKLYELKPLIYPLINSSIDSVRIAAQITIINLERNDPFSFLDKLEVELSEWDQVQLHHAISLYQNKDVPMMARFLFAPLPSVVAFSLKLIGVYHQEDAILEVKDCLLHENRLVCMEAARTLMKIDTADCVKYLCEFLVESNIDRMILNEILIYLFTNSIETKYLSIIKKYISHESLPIRAASISILNNSDEGKLMLRDYLSSCSIEKAEEIDSVIHNNIL